ncbi:MAG: type VI secretion system membrane subunit TssM, partial [Pseudomonadota bacterium]
MSDETKLTEQRGVSASGLAEGAQNVGALEVQSALSSRSQRLLEALSSGFGDSVTGGGEEPAAPGQFVEDRFAWLHTFVAEIDGQPSQMSELMGRLTEVYQELNKLSTPGIGAGDVTAIARFQEFASRLEGPLPRWATQISG